jgi:hypothetical protein
VEGRPTAGSARPCRRRTNVASGNEEDLRSLYDWLRTESGPVLSAGDDNAFLDQPGVARFKTYFRDADDADNELAAAPIAAADPARSPW